MAFLDFARYFGAMSGQFCKYLSNTYTTVKRPFVQDYLGGPVPEKKHSPTHTHPGQQTLYQLTYVKFLQNFVHQNY